GDFHRVSLKLPAWQSLAPGATVDLSFNYYLPVSTPSNWTVTISGTTYALAGDLARGTTVVEPGGTTPTDPGEPGDCTDPAWNASTAYGGGSVVSHEGRVWRAQWWTQGEEPGTTGEWGVWRDQGAC